MDSDKKDFLLVLLYLYLQHAKYKKARVVLDLLTTFYPDDMHVIRSAAFLHMEVGEADKAIEAAERILKTPDATKHNQAFAYLLKSRAYWAQGEKAQAEHNLMELTKTGEVFE